MWSWSVSDNHDPKGSFEQPEVASSSGCLVRLLWLLAGPLALILGTGLLVDTSRPSTLVGNSFVWGAALSMVAIRYLDLRYFEGLGADSKPSTMSDFRRYTVWVLALAVVISGVAFWLRS